MRSTALILLVAFGAAACSTTPSDLVPAVVPVGEPVPIANLDWFLTEDAAETKLAYGRANSDDLRLALTCVPGSGQLSLMQPASKAVNDIHLESGGDTERFAAVVEPAGVHDGDLLMAEAKTSVPVFLRFRDLGWLATWQGQQREMLAAHPPSKPSVERFFAVCG
jgi:hypothetical protein